MLATVVDMPAMTRGPLPAGTYWRRRLFVGLLATGVVFVIATSLGAGGDATPDQDPVARHAGSESTAQSAAPSSDSTRAEEEATQDAQGNTGDKKTGKRLATPSGDCAAGDIEVKPTTKQAVAGQPIELTLALRTRTNPACHWTVNQKRIAVRISDSDGEVWSTRHCSGEIDAQQVVLRSAEPTEVALTWDARRSDDGCPEETEWVLPGQYDVTAAVLGGEPGERSLKLVAPGEASSKPELQAEVKTGNALERLEKRQQRDEDQS